MTAQIADLFKFQGKTYSIAGISEGELFVPSTLGLEPSMTSTACWRGYRVTYGIQTERLVVADLSVNLVEGTGLEFKPVRGPDINGVPPVMPEGEGVSFSNEYKAVNLHLEYSGGVLIAGGFIDALYTHMGFHPAWKYETVFELVFENGMIISADDRSSEMSAIRTRVLEHPPGESGEMPSRAEIAEFVKRAFDRTYRRK